jgi:hypothetical protein
MSYLTQKKKRFQRYQEFKQNESVQLVRQYLSCIDELANVHMIFSSSLKMLNTLKKHLKEREGIDPNPEPNPEDTDIETAEKRVDWAISVCQEAVDNFDELLKDLRQSYTAVWPS